MEIKALLDRVDMFYSLAAGLADRRLKNRVALVNKSNLGPTIYIYDRSGQIKAGITLQKYQGLSSNDYVHQYPTYEITSIVATTAMDALACIVLGWKLGGAIVPDQLSVSDSAFALINNYYKKNKDNPQLIQPLFTNSDPLRSIYLPNPSLFSIVSDIEIKDAAYNPSELRSKEEIDFDDLFESKYKGEDIIPVSEEHAENMREQAEWDEKQKQKKLPESL